MAAVIDSISLGSYASEMSVPASSYILFYTDSIFYTGLVPKRRCHYPSRIFFLSLFKIMKAILSIFVILLVLLLIISTLGGSIRTNEQFVESVSSEDVSSYNPSDYVPPSAPKPPTKPSSESQTGTQNFYFIANPPLETNTSDSTPNVNPSNTPLNPYLPRLNDSVETQMSQINNDPQMIEAIQSQIPKVPDIIEGYDDADFYAPA